MYELANRGRFAVIPGHGTTCSNRVSGSGVSYVSRENFSLNAPELANLALE
jgi:hypothetical protein